METKTRPSPTEQKTADLSPDGVYRYLLTRWWGDPKVSTWRQQRAPLFVMLNPSTADATLDDNTIRRCRGFAKDWGYQGFKVVNLYAYRATDPRDLRAAGYPIGPRNKQAITEELMSALRLNAPVVVAWGAHARPEGIAHFNECLDEAHGEIHTYCLGTTVQGQPRHPLMLAGNTPLERWS